MKNLQNVGFSSKTLGQKRALHRMARELKARSMTSPREHSQDDKMKLPFWLNLAADGEPGEKTSLSPEFIQKVLQALKNNKRVVVMNAGKPYVITHSNGTVTVTPIESFEFDKK